jgi:hypothetical protein
MPDLLIRLLPHIDNAHAFKARRQAYIATCSRRTSAA